MIELPIIVDLTVNKNDVVFEFDLENLNPEIEFTASNVINVEFPTYDGDYTVDASVHNPVVLETQGKVMNDDVTVNQLQELEVSSHTITVNSDTGAVRSTATFTKGYAENAFAIMKALQLPTHSAQVFNPSTTGYRILEKGEYLTGDIYLNAIPTYQGETTFTPSDETQVIAVRNLMPTTDITINPVPNNYGKIEWNGSYLKVS